MTRLDESARGVFIISVTPFEASGALDLGGADALMEFYLERGVSGVTLLGIMGEAPKLTFAESRAFARRAIGRVRGRVPVVVGVSAAGLAPLAELARAVMDDRAAGVMVTPPPGTRGDAGALAYFTQVAEALGDIPMVLQDYPQANAVHVTAEGIARIIAAVPSCVMVKHEDWPGLAKLGALRRAGGRRVSILVGNNAVFLPEELRRGADGAMTGFAFPEMMTGVVAAHEAGDGERAADIFDAYLPLARYEQQPGIGLAARKHLLARRGALACAAQRRPASVLGPDDIADIELLLARQTRRLHELGLDAPALRDAA